MADIRGFTHFSQSVEPSKATKTLQEILKLLHESIYASGGLVDKHLGDGLMGVFGIGRSAVVDRAVEAVDKLPRPILTSENALAPKKPESFDSPLGSLTATRCWERSEPTAGLSLPSSDSLRTSQRVFKNFQSGRFSPKTVPLCWASLTRLWQLPLIYQHLYRPAGIR